nr:hypothetical protein Itr_chr05CG20390 [Ipomoea trifida]
MLVLFFRYTLFSPRGFRFSMVTGECHDVVSSSFSPFPNSLSSIFVMDLCNDIFFALFKLLVTVD